MPAVNGVQRRKGLCKYIQAIVQTDQLLGHMSQSLVLGVSVLVRDSLWSLWQGSANSDPWHATFVSKNCFIQIKTCSFICILSIKCFYTTQAELSNCNKKHMSKKGLNFYYLAHYKKKKVCLCLVYGKPQ